MDTRQILISPLLLDEVCKDLCIRRRLEKASPVLKFLTKLFIVYDLAVVRQSEIAGIMVKKERLDVLSSLAAGIAVADVANGHLTLKLSHLRLVEDLSHETFASCSVEATFSVNSHDTATLLTTMLKGVQAIISKACSILNTIDSKHTTLVVKLVIPIIVFTLTHCCSFFNVIPSDRRESRNLSYRFLHSLRSVEMTVCYSPLKYATALWKSGCSRVSSSMFLKRFSSKRSMCPILPRI